MNELSTCLELLRDEKIGFTQFAIRTRVTWDSLAAWLLRRYKVPSAVAREDVVQEILLAVHQFVPKWDPTHGVPLKNYVVWNARDKAKKWILKQRNTKRRDGKAPARFERAITGMTADELGEEIIMSIASVPPCQEEGMERAEALQAVQNTDLVFCVFQQTGDADAAARALYENRNARLALRLDTIETARAIVERSIEDAAERIAASAA